MRYVALLRGINVGGNTMIKMEGLRKMFEGLGFRNVASYINSGNLAFDSRKTAEEKLIAKIEKAIERNFGKKVAVMMRTQDEIRDILGRNPFEGQFESHKEMHVLFMNDQMPAEKKALLIEKQTEDERFFVDGREIFCHLRLGVADSLLGKGFIDKKLKVPITGRNWRTVEMIAAL
ncbi:MAG: DUF1697 domain-containing protein [Pyrinomonadaceae bacterium]